MKYRCRHKWTPEDIDYLRRSYGVIPTLEIAAHIGVGEGSIFFQAQKHGINQRSIRAWSEVDMEYMREHYGRMPNPELAAKMSRSVSSITTMARKLGVANRYKTWHRWTAEQLDYLVTHWGKMSSKDMSAQLGLSVQTIDARASKLGLRNKPTPAQAPQPLPQQEKPREDIAPVQAVAHKGGRVHQWTGSEMAYLQAHFPKEPTRQVAKALGLSETCVSAKACRLGIVKTLEFRGRDKGSRSKARVIDPRKDVILDEKPTRKKKDCEIWDDKIERRCRERYHRLMEIERIFDDYDMNGYPGGVDIDALAREHKQLVSQLSSFTVPERYRIDVNV